MAFGFPELKTLLDEAKPNENIKMKCKGYIMHLLGHSVGFVHEVTQRDY